MVKPSLKEQLEALRLMPDEAIDTSDIPEVTDFNGFKRGLFKGERIPGTLKIRS